VLLFAFSLSANGHILTKLHHFKLFHKGLSHVFLHVLFDVTCEFVLFL
jgi:hypothetical protein